MNVPTKSPILLTLGLAVLACASPPAPVEAPDGLRQLTSLEGHESQAAFSPDGHWIAFVHRLGTESDLYVVPSEGSSVRAPEPLDVAPGSSAENPAWSPDGDAIAFVSDRSGTAAIWLVPAFGGEARQLTPQELAASRPWWSPDGRFLAFNGTAEDGRHVWLLEVASGGSRQLTHGPGEQYQYGWSPDGRAVLFAQWEDSADDLWSVDVETGELRELLDHDGEEYWPNWSPDGRSIVFYTTWEDRMTDIWILDLASGEPTALTDHPGEDFVPKWSPDGQFIAFHSDRESKSGLWMAPVGGEPIALVTWARVPAPAVWSPDSRFLVFSLLASRAVLFEVPVAGGATVSLTDGSFNVFNPAVASNGRMAFDSDRWNSERDLFFKPSRDDASISLTREVANNGYPSWSPDGRRLAYKGNPGGGNRTGQVWTLDPEDPTDGRQVTTHGYVRFPVWCGEEIVFRYEDDSLGDGAGQIWTVPAAGGTSRQLTTTPGGKIPTDCTRDGRRVLFTARDGDDEHVGVLSLDADGRPVGEVLLGDGEGARWSPDEERLAFISRRDGWCDLYVMDAGGESVERVTRSTSCESWPDWSADRESLIYAANLGDFDLWRIDVTEGRSVRGARPRGERGAP